VDSCVKALVECRDSLPTGVAVGRGPVKCRHLESFFPQGPQQARKEVTVEFQVGEVIYPNHGIGVVETSRHVIPGERSALPAAHHSDSRALPQQNADGVGLHP
jgi:hypothetical protein